MKQLLMFNFGIDVYDMESIFVNVTLPNDTDLKDFKGTVEDCIFSYVEAIEFECDYKKLVTDVLDSFNLEYEFIEPLEFLI